MISCSECGARESGGDHWFLLWTERDGVRCCFIPLDADPAMVREYGVQTVCGERCLHKAVQRHVESSTARKQS
jgi:hypothetical protein